MRKITFYASFDEQKQQEVKDVLKLSPLERIGQVVELIRKVYAAKGEKVSSTKRIHFIQ